MQIGQKQNPGSAQLSGPVFCAGSLVQRLLFEGFGFFTKHIGEEHDAGGDTDQAAHKAAVVHGHGQGDILLTLAGLPGPDSIFVFIVCEQHSSFPFIVCYKKYTSFATSKSLKGFSSLCTNEKKKQEKPKFFLIFAICLIYNFYNLIYSYFFVYSCCVLFAFLLSGEALRSGAVFVLSLGRLSGLWFVPSSAGGLYGSSKFLAPLSRRQTTPMHASEARRRAV